jgi:ABC-2 type transport system ATP-binding protein
MEILKVEHVVKRFGSYEASSDISFSLQKGRILGLLGPNGAGKTTMIRMINNILFPDEGRISLFGEQVGALHQNLIGYLPEERGLYKKIKVIDQLIYFGQLKGMSRQSAQKAAQEWLYKLDAGDWAPKKIQELSKGMQQKVQFISSILHSPELLILDEPFSGFDPINVDVLKRIILDLKAEGKTIILSTHVMEQAEQLCDDICLINKGKIILDGTLRDVKRSYGRDTVIIEFEGSGEFLDKFAGLKFINRTDNRAEFRINPVISIKNIIQEAFANVELIRFEFNEPSLHEIFVDVVSRKELRK